MLVYKRLIDILFALVGISFLMPLLPVLGLLIKLDSRGPVFYLTERVGKDMQVFRMVKFRTMINTSVEVGQSVCPQNDPRVTFFGRFLRRTKMNELPQFLNILKGEMTFVGPRPEAPDLAQLYPAEARKLFSVKPGLIGPATILGRNEEECYPPGVDSKKYYIEHILPAKLKLDLEYIDNGTPFKDLGYILSGIRETLFGALKRRHITDNRSQIYLILVDFFIIVASYAFASGLYRLEYMVDEERLIGFLFTVSAVVAIRFGCFVFFGMYGSLIRYISYREVVVVLKAVSASSIILVLFFSFTGLIHYPNYTAIVDWACLLGLLTAIRWSLRFYWEQKRGKNDKKSKRRILIYGAGDAGYRVYRALASNKYSPVETIGFVDDKPDKYGKVLNGVKVLGNRYHITELAKLYRIDEILIAEQKTSPDTMLEIARVCREAKLRCRLLPAFQQNGSNDHNNLVVRNLEFSDLLPLERPQANHDGVRKVVEGKTILINGSGGSLGLELCQRLLQIGCSRLIIVERYESYLNETVTGLLKNYPKEKIVPVLTDMDKKYDPENIFKKYCPNIVIQAGMRKYKSIFELPLERMCRTYYRYTLNLAKLAAKYQCDLFLMISSIMAGQGDNLIDDLLKKAEISLMRFFDSRKTQLIISRLCDIAENRGSIVSILEDQIINQGLVILPAEDAQCCLITKYSAAEFILENIAKEKNDLASECVFVCDAGSRMSLIELTRRLASYHGLNLWSDLEIKYIGESDERLDLASQPV